MTVTDDDPAVEVLADLTHHLKPVNVVRFAPIRDILLASADDGQSSRTVPVYRSPRVGLDARRHYILFYICRSMSRYKRLVIISFLQESI